MSKCKECIIGILNYCEGYDLATVDEVKKHIEDHHRFNEYLDEKYGNDNAWLKHIRKTEWTWKQYCDRRVNTDLTRFNHCPFCGERIDWRKLKNEQH